TKICVTPKVTKFFTPFFKKSVPLGIFRLYITDTIDNTMLLTTTFKTAGKKTPFCVFFPAAIQTKFRM
ncbi:MAG: hypothetical protein J7578_08890, partial [Chitinophagaceae bacterium]|nr:hypothetical protein [Chitinophagaceae bacterium]